MMKTLLMTLAALFAFSAHGETLSVAATPTPHAEILEFVKPMLAKEGVDLKVRVFTDYVQPNLQVDQKNIDANCYQHLPFLNDFNASRKTHLVSVVGVSLVPMGGYSSKIKHISELPQGATVAIPNDVTNGGRALLLLQKFGVITLKPEAGIAATPKDIVENPKGIKLLELEAATLPRVLSQVDLALITTNYALEAKLSPAKDSIIIEDKDSPYMIYLVARPDNKDSDAMKKLTKALTSPETRQFIAEKYQGSVLPAF